MKRRLILLALLIFVVAITFFAFRESPLPQADFIYVLGDSIRTLDPAKMSWSEDIRIALGIWEGLAAYDPCTVEPISAVAYIPPDISPDGLTYTFQIRPNARWSNGDPVTAQDFLYAWRRAIEPGTAEDYAFLITDNIAGAADYSAWRNQAVRVLTLLRDLAQGKIIEPEDQTFLDSLNLIPASDTAPDYPAIAQQFRAQHLAEQDARFAQVAVQALDDQHLRVTLVRPTSYFLDLVAFSTFLPIHRSIELLRETNDPTVTDLTLWVFDPQWVKPDYHRNNYPGLITNGPFTLADWQFKRYMLFQRNPYYWDRANVPSNRILARIIPQANTAFLAYEQGEVHWLNDVTRLDFAPRLIEQAQQGLRPDIHITPAFATYFYNFNCQPTLPDGSTNPFADPNVRLAFNLAIDKQAIVTQVLRRGNLPAYNFIPPNSIPNYYCPPGPSYNPQRARELLAQAGYPNGQNLPTVEILYNTGFGHETTAQAVAEMWRQQLNVSVALQGKEVKTFAADLQNHQFMICRASWFGDYGDPTTFLDKMISTNGNNDCAFNYPPYDQLMAQAAATIDPQQRLDILAQAETIITQQQLPIIPLYYYVNIAAFRPNVQGLYSNSRDMHPFKYLTTQP
ncbi:MAG: peptide ABC transporter substrate-binding protein [Sedimentisphaerales bacterium]|nr:peptide ABC transporter substrate-binding protein [Sedimentisphaerales bacterium]